jgi:S-adenosyl methyltransferase
MGAGGFAEEEAVMPESSDSGSWMSADRGRAAPEIKTNVAHPARVYDYWLGGKDNFAADRAMGDAIMEAVPTI